MFGKKLALCVGLIVVLGACGKKDSNTGNSGNQFDENNVVVRSRATFELTTDSESGSMKFRAAASGSVPVTVTNAALTDMSIDASAFVVPTISNAVLDFGTIALATLTDNDLKVCGAGGNQKCNTALLRMYTTGTAKAGLYNAADDYGLPITATLTTPLTVGLGVANAAIMQTLSLPANKRVVRKADFSPAPTYNMKIDFTDAGVGSFSTTIVLEYALSL